MTEAEKKAKRKKQQAEWAKQKRAAKKPAADKPAKPKKEKAPKPEKPEGARAAKNHARKEDAVRKALKSGALDAKEVAERIISRYDSLRKAEANVSNVGKRAGEAIKDAKKSFESVIEETVGVEDNGAKARKLDKLVLKYGELQATVSDGAAKRAKAKKARKQAHEKFDRAIESASQPDLPHMDDDDSDDESGDEEEAAE